MGGGGSKEVADKPVVVVVGAGYGGVVVAKELDATGNFNVVLVDRKDYFLHSLAGLRAAVSKDWAGRIMVPYTKLLKHGTVVHGEVLEVGPKGVGVFGLDEPITFDYLVIATGSSYAFPGKIALPHREESLNKYFDTTEIIKSVEKVLIIGGGPVGVELAGEILEFYPDKEVTLVHSQPKLIGSGLSTKFMDKTEEQLRAKGARIILNERVDLNYQDLKEEIQILPDYYVAGSRTVKTDKGTEIDTDIIFICTGIKINNKSFSPHFSDLMNNEGRLRVNKHFQLEGYENIFAIGDCCDKEAKMAYYAAKHGSCVATNIGILEQNKTRTKPKALVPYTPAEHPVMFVSIGSYGGVAQLPISSQTVLGATLVSMIKSRSLFVQRYWTYHNQSLNWDNPDPDTLLEKEKIEVKTKNLGAALGVTQEEANDLLQQSLPMVERDEGEAHT